MVKEIKGQITAGKANYAIVVSRFNEFITTKLLAGAIDVLTRHGCKPEQITSVFVPGAFKRRTASRARASVAKGPSLLSVFGSGRVPDQVSVPCGDT